MTTVSVVIPCYRSTSGFPQRVRSVVSELEALGVDVEVLLVADGLETARSLPYKEASTLGPSVKPVVHIRNYGEQQAVRTGILLSTGAVIVTLDDDGQHKPEDIRLLVEPVLSGEALLVYGLPRGNPHGRARTFLSRTGKSIVTNFLGVPASSISSFRAFSGRLREAFATAGSRGLIVDSVLLDHADEPAGVLLDFVVRAEGKSGYSPRDLLRHAIDLFFSFPGRPLRFVAVLGAVGVVVGMTVMGATAVAAFYLGGLPDGYATIVGLVAFLSGIQLVGISVVAEYVGRLYEQGIRSDAISARDFEPLKD